MKNYLSQTWDLGIAMGELASSALLILFILIARNIFNKQKNKFALSIGLIVFVSTLIGWAIGSAFKGSGHGLSLLTPIMPFLLSYHYDEYHALGFIIGFQIIGSVIGFCLYLVYKFLMDEKPRKIENENQTFKSSIAKNLVFQPLVVISLLGIAILDFTAYNTGMILNALALGSAIALISLLTQNIGFVMFSPLISIAVIAESIIDKQNWKRLLLNFLIEISLQILFAILVIVADVALLEHREVR